MVFRAAIWLGLVLALAMPAAAQQQAPYIYDEDPGRGLRVARKDKPAEQIAAEQAAADTAETACNAGELAGCAALGLAFRDGAGRPQNRPVAELLLRQACDGADAAGCLGLGVLLRSVKEPDILAAGTLVLGRGCRLGDLEACAKEADAVEAGTNRDGDKEAALALRRAVCASGGTTACRTLGSLLVGSDDPAVREEGLALLGRQCRAGDGQACGGVLYPLGQANPPRPALVQEMTEHGCRAGVPYLCRELGDMLFAQGSGPPESRAAAMTAFDRACALSDAFCTTPAMIRARPALEDSCQRQVQADCLALGRIYSRDDLPLYDPRQAAILLGRACEAGETEGCGAAARALDEAGLSESPEDAAAITRWYLIGCEGGANDDCETLGTNVLAADPGPEDRARGYAVLTLACERGRIESCSRLEHFAGMDPADPVLSVDARYTPPLTEEEEAEQNRLEREANEAAEAEAEANRCRTSQVEFRGVVYTDTLCELRAVGVIGGRFARAGEAPWQALLWRPERMNGRTLTPAERVECGGALVRTGWILTAAHCVVDSKRRPLLTGGHQFRLGVLDARNLEGVGYPIKRVFAHPRYHEASRTFDIALVELDANQRTRVGGPHDIKIIGIDRTPIAQRPIRAGMPVYVFGWGLTTVRGNASNRLKAARLQLEAPADCEKNTATGGNNYLKSSLLCAKAPDKSQACDGDSGGPLVSYDGNLATVIGVVSAGTECGQAEKATRYTRVAKVVDWINSVFAGRETPIAPRATR